MLTKEQEDLLVFIRDGNDMDNPLYLKDMNAIIRELDIKLFDKELQLTLEHLSKTQGETL